MAIAFDVADAATSNASGAALDITCNATAGSTVVLWVFFNGTTASGAITAVYDQGGANTAMTQVGSTITGSTNGSNRLYFAAFTLSNVAGGAKTVRASPAASQSGIKMCTVSYTGVGSVGTSITSTGGAGSGAHTISSVPSATGHLVSACFAGYTAVYSAFTGTQRFYNATGSFAAPFLVGDVAGATTVSPSSTANAAANWGAAAFDLLPVSGTTVTPSGASVSATGGVPDVVRPVTPGGVNIGLTGGQPSVQAGGDQVLQPAAPSPTLTGGIPTVTAPGGVTPGGATASATGGTPIIGGPLAALLGKLAAGQSGTIQVLGDSTAFGSLDAYQTTLFGWPGRLTLALARYYDMDARAYCWNYPSNTFYGSAVALNTSNGHPGGPMLTVYVGGWPGATFANLVSSMTAMTPASAVDVIISNTGFNESSSISFASNYLTYVANLKAKYPGVPIVVTTENATTIANESGHAVLFTTLFQAMINDFLSGKSQPLSPALQPATLVSGVWVLDTQQAGQGAAALNPDGLHPNSTGYGMQAAWMLSQLAPNVPYAFPTEATGSLSGGTPVVTNPVTATPSGATVAATAGTPAVTTTVLVTPSGGAVTATGGTPGVVAPATVTPDGLTVTSAGGAPGVTAPQVATPDGGTVTAGGGTPIVQITDPVELNPPPSQRINAVLKRSRINPVFSGRWVMGTQDLPYKQDPSDVVDYLNDWRVAGSSSLADGEVIVSSTWAAYDKDWEPVGDVSVNSPAPSFTDSTTTVWVSGGAVGATCYISNHIVTDRGLEKDESFRVRFEEQ